MEIADYVRRVAHDRTIRLVATARLRDSVLLRLVDNEDLSALEEIEAATSGRLRAQEGGSDRLDRRELVFGIPHAHFINASFSYWLPKSLNRFNGPGRGAWYAALELETSVAEVAFHMERELANVSDFNTAVDYAEMLASFIGDFVDVCHSAPKPVFLHPDPAEAYKDGNRFADAVRAAGHYGIIYPSLRRTDGTCLVALVPHAVQSVAQGRVLRLEWMGAPGPRVTELAGT